MTQKIESTIAAFVKRGEQLDAQRPDAQSALDKATTARQDALLGFDDIEDAKLASLQRGVGDAASLLEGINEAINILAHQKTDVEAQPAAERHRVKRAEAADNLTAQIAAIEAALAPWLAQSRILAEALMEIAHQHFRANEWGSTC